MNAIWRPVLEHLGLVAEPVAEAIGALGEDGRLIEVASIDPEHADTDAMTKLWGTDLFESVNCVVIAGKRAGNERLAACCVRATTKADINHAVKRLLDVRKCSFMPTERAVAETGMSYGGITPIGLPWRILLDEQVPGAPAIIGSGLRTSKLRLPGDLLTRLPGAEIHPIAM